MIAPEEFQGEMSAPIARLAVAISDDLEQALAYHEMFTLTAYDTKLVDRIKEIPPINPGFNAISECLHLGCILALCRLWDKPRDSAHIPAVATELRRQLARGFSGDSDLMVDREPIQKWLDDAEVVEKSNQLRALIEFRHVGLAHRADPNRPDPRARRNVRRVVYGDEGFDLVDRLNRLIGYPRSSMGDLRSIWQEWAAMFWDRVGGQA
jgi:hypothetical protein